MERLQKYIASCGIASRRKAEELITEGKVQVNGRKVTELGVKINPQKDKVKVNGQLLAQEKPVYYLLNKPKGVITSVSDPQGRETVLDYIKNETKRIYPIGRLDLYTEGLLLLTNDGVLAHNLLSPKKHIDKTYFAILDGPVGTKEQELFLQGLDIGDEKLALPAKLELTENENEVFITVQEGRFHQVKRMAQAVGRNVTYLKRISMGNLVLDPNLKKGEYRSLTEKELTSLKKK